MTMYLLYKPLVVEICVHIHILMYMCTQFIQTCVCSYVHFEV